MVVGPTSANFEYQPVFKPFFEMAAMAIIATVAVGELVRSFGVDLNAEGNIWSSLLDIVLAGQSEFEEMLEAPERVALRQRIHTVARVETPLVPVKICSETASRTMLMT